MKMLSRKRWISPDLFLILLPLLGLVSCGTPAFGASSPPQNIQIDWVNFVRFGGITYIASTSAGRALTPNDLGPVFATTSFQLADNVHDPAYHAKDGDAAFILAGTKVYTVKGYRPTFRLAVRENNTVTLYQADTNPQARLGEDLLDIDGKVIALGIVSAEDGVTELASIKNSQQVAKLVTLVLHAPVDQTRRESGGKRQYFIAFHLADGTTVTQSYWLDTNEMARGILLPEAFGQAIQAALPASH